jgi:glucose-1-phosphate adenylyltransferase
MTANDQTPRFVSRLTRSTLALVLAGGRGSRLRQLTDWRCKPAVPFGGKFRIIDFALSNCINSGIRRIGVVTQYRPHSLIRHIQNGWSFLRGEFGEYVELLPASQRMPGSSWYTGTADAVYQNLGLVQGHGPELVLVLAGDHVYKMDYGPMVAEHVARGADMTVGCIEVPVSQARAFGVMGVNDEGKVVRFDEKPPDPVPIPGREDVALASMGIYVFSANVLYQALTGDADDAGSSHDFGKDIIPGLVEGGARVHAYAFRDVQSGKQVYWRDVGTVDAFWSANMELIAVQPELNLYDKDWPIWTYQEQLPPAKFVFNDDGRRGQAVDSMVSGGCIVSGASLLKTVLFSGVRVEQGSALEDAVVLPHAHIGEGCRIWRAVIDQWCDLPAGTVIGEDPVEDARRFEVSAGGVVLVTPEMLGQRPGELR